MAYQILATLATYACLYGLIVFIGKLPDVKNPINSQLHLLRAAVRLAVVLVVLATPCVLLGAHPVLIIGLFLVLPILTAGPLGFSPLGLPTILIYGWITMPPGTSVMSHLTHQNKPSKESSETQNTDSALNGLTGMTTTVLRPHGKVQVNGKDYEAKAQIGLIQANRSVVVIRSENNLLVVEERQAVDEEAD